MYGGKNMNTMKKTVDGFCGQGNKKRAVALFHSFLCIYIQA